VTDLVETLAWLVDIPSETGSETEIRDAIAERLGRFPQTFVGRSVVVGEPGPDKVLLVGHTDTVPLQGHVGARIESDRLHGLGATDMKSGLAVMIHLLEDLGDESLAGVFYAGEEGPISGNDLGAILGEEPWLTKAAAAVVMEPTNRELQFGCQGAVNARVVFMGEAAHSARPWLGENAITKASGFLEHMGKLEPHPHIVGGLEFTEVMSVTRAEGGVANNIIPSEFVMNVNYRFAPDRSLDEAIAHLERVCEGVDGFTVSDTAPAGQVDNDDPLFARLTEVTGAASSGKQGWTDVAQLSAVGVPAVNFGPGETALAHKPGESVSIDDLSWFYESLSAVLR
jgi:succinyl-diaminopimelate desuccinylase